jgi:hypothetical protein
VFPNFAIIPAQAGNPGSVLKRPDIGLIPL